MSFQVSLVFDSKSNRTCYYSRLLVPASQKYAISFLIRELKPVLEWPCCAPVLETEWWGLCFVGF